MVTSHSLIKGYIDMNYIYDCHHAKEALKLIGAEGMHYFYDYARGHYVLVDESASLVNPTVIGRFDSKANLLSFIKASN